MSSVAYSFFYDRGRVNSKTKPISSIGEKIADANSVVLLKALCASSVAGKKDVLGQSGTSRLLIRPDCPYTLIDRPT